VIYRGRHLATVEPLNPKATVYNKLYVSGVEANGWYTFHMDYLEDKVSQLQEEGFVVEVR
jgi:hypothetical protein